MSTMFSEQLNRAMAGGSQCNRLTVRVMTAKSECDMRRGQPMLTVSMVAMKASIEIYL